MKFKVFSFTILFLALAGSITNSFSQSWECISKENSDIYFALINQESGESIYVGIKNGIMKSQDGGTNWQQSLKVGGSCGAGNYITLDSSGEIYAATGNGLFRSSNQGKSWQRIFKGRNYLESQCTAVLIHLNVVYLGTRKGLFISRDSGRTWNRQISIFGENGIISIVAEKSKNGCVYVASSKGVFKSLDEGCSWNKIFNGKVSEEDVFSQESGQEFSDENSSYIKYMVIDNNFLKRLYLATSNGIYMSQDAGQNWEKLNEYGLLDKDFSFMLVSNDSVLYTATKKSVYRFESDRWRELSFGVTVSNVKSLSLDLNNNLYVCDKKGLFRMKKFIIDQSVVGGNLGAANNDCPGIKDVQKAAVKYAEVEPEKIQLWRKQAATKALLPKFSAGVNRNTTDLWHWESGSSTKAYDDVLMKGNDAIEWDVSLSWDFGDLVWNNDQTAIDSRSKLMVELRSDIIDEVTKIYFERVRLMAELSNLQIEDRKKRFDKELKLKELTALLDGYTGGYFSDNLKVNQG